MVRRQHAQRSIFEMILPDGEQLWDRELQGIDEVLKEEALIEEVEEGLRRRRPKSGVLGRPGTRATVVLRMLVLKHLYHWSYRECEREVRGSLVYRGFCGRGAGDHAYGEEDRRGGWTRGRGAFGTVHGA